MALPVTIPNTFASATASIPLSQLDTNFTTLANAVNGISDGSETLANVTATVANITTANVGALNTSGAVVFNDAGADVDFRVEGDTDANLLFVDASADKVGIGTNSPNAKLTSATGSGTTAISIIDTSNTLLGTETNYLSFFGTSNSSTLITTPLAQIGAISQNGTYQQGSLVFHTTPFNGSSTERARITSGGFFKAKGNETNYENSTSSNHEFSNGAGDNVTATFYHTAASPYGIYVKFSNDPNNATNYVFKAETGATNIYTIFSNGTVSARSDAKWKKNIETTRDGYAEDLARLRVVKYNWYNHEDGTPKELGLIAQEVEEVFPGLVQTDEDMKEEVRTREVPAVLDEDGNEVEPARTEEYTEKVGTGEYSKSIKFSVFVPMLIKVCQEQQQRIETLEAKVAALENA